MAGSSGSTHLKLSSITLLSFALAGCRLAVGPLPPGQPDAYFVDSGAPFDGGHALDGGLPPLEVCAQLNAARCASLSRCGLIASDNASLGACLRNFEATWCGPSTWPNHVAVGSLRLDSSRALACVGALETQACSEWPTLPDSCSRFLLPRAALGQPCFDGYDECLDGVCRGSACPRTCQPRALLDEACNGDAECRAGLYCRFSPLNPGVGQCAMQSSANGACLKDVDCATGLICSQSTCKVLPTAGALCLDGRCTESNYCEGDTCRPRKELGAACDNHECLTSLVCDSRSKSCVTKVVGLHDSCSDMQRCPNGTVCVGISSNGVGTCALPADQGESCTNTTDCRPYLSCVTADGGATCERRADAGTACVESFECQSSAHCEASSCVELPLPGQSCASSRRCRWGLCRDVAGTDGGAVCGALLSAGIDCRSDAECSSGSCREGRCLARCVP